MDDERRREDAQQSQPPKGEQRSFKVVESDAAYRTDTFSRNDREGLPAEPCAEEESPKTSSVEATPDADPRKAQDDADSREATPPPPHGGGVR